MNNKSCKDSYNEYYLWFLLVSKLELHNKTISAGTIFLFDVLNKTFFPISPLGQEDIFVNIPPVLISNYGLFQQIKLPWDVESFIKGESVFRRQENPYMYAHEGTELMLPYIIVDNDFSIHEQVKLTHHTHSMGEICYN